MHCQQPLYLCFFKAQDRFNNKLTSGGFEPDVIQDYIHSAMNLSSFYEPGATNENTLLCELFLRRLYFDLLDAIQDPIRSRIFRRVCLDSIHTPLLCLKRFYYHWDDGDIRFLQLQQQLQRIQAPLD
ncbi:hypothetical protein OH458_14245 [Vibrio sp. MarTm2]|jgi:hypothetical protein|uniref:Uncharacterized protein n=1 Tax=Vibrio variabilis TaxID=990271 RepID=A0ABR4Y7K5_9VIBR|nr:MULTISPECIES: hypothetical protein [Vibrio]EED28127.1 conserved hypothetical protein [Vibrio sp. 16]KHA59458.1 hypothetical protein NL53_17135 [Vibrio variabilis]KHT48009.1 hypothetical protein RJ47_02465 [Vibrio sinaloensis]KIE22133.1 hypothetical protein SE23_05555 [Vibrio sinaloensis]MDA0129224.1 hypothetical protein [Vibrio sp. MarTm2]